MPYQSTYHAPVEQLLKLGDDSIRKLVWLDYLQMGISDQDIPELIRMATDEDLLWSPQESRRVWAPVHAWRALGELRAEAAIEPLLSLFDELSDDDWVGENIPLVFGVIGPTALPVLQRYMADPSPEEFSLVHASEAIWHIAQLHPESAGRCTGILFKQLMRFEKQPPIFNAFLIMRLVDLKYTAAESLIRLAFKHQMVDELLMGDYAMVERQLHETDPREVTIRKEHNEAEIGFLRKYI